MAGATALASIAHAVSYPAQLVAYWNADEGSGLVVVDSLGENNGTLMNGASWTEGKVGSAVFFDGVDDFIEVPDASTLDMANALTLEAWIFPQSVSGEVVLFRKGGECGNFTLFIRSEKLALLSSDSCSWGNAGNNSPLLVDAWQHIAVTYDGASIRYYINGELTDIVGVDGVGAENTNALTMGGPNPGVGSVHFNGMMDEVALYSSALSAETIEEHYLAGLAGNSYFPDYNTPTGSDVEVEVEDATIIFSQVDVAGDTTITASESGEPLPGGFQLGNTPTYYIVETTALFSGPVEACLPYDENALSGTEENLRVLHFVDGEWQDVTSSIDTNANIICFEVESFSQFVVALEQTVGDLASMVEGASMHDGLKASLLGKLNAALERLEQGDTGVSVRLLEAFMREVDMLAGKKILPGEAGDLIDYAEDLIESLE